MIRRLSMFFAVALLTWSQAADAHFIWLVEDHNTGNVHVRFGEDGHDDGAGFLSYVKGVRPHLVSKDHAAVPVPLEVTDDAIFMKTQEGRDAVIVVSHDLGVMERGDSVFRLRYYAKAGPHAGDGAWTTAKTEDDLKLDVVPELKNDSVHLSVIFDGRPVGGAEVTVGCPADVDFQGTTDNSGQATVPATEAGLYSVRVRHVEHQAGELDGKAYPETRHYCTIALTVNESGSLSTTSPFHHLPQPVTSFGAAIVGSSLYMYGGHTGSAHSYSTSEQSNILSRLDLKSGEWSTVNTGPRLQGLAMVAYEGRLYRIGGFTALNAEGEEHNLKSQDTVARFDPDAGVWDRLPSLPEPRSSHDAAVVGDTIYVVGGWMLANGDSQWHSTAWKMNLAADEPRWEAVAEPPFRRRALALAAHDGRLYVVGGMQEAGGPTTEVAVYDPATDEWSTAPGLAQQTPDDASEESSRFRRNMTGFGASAFATGGSLYATTVDGHLQRLSADGTRWEIIARDLRPRFFHRLLPLDDHRLIAVGGANMEIGKFEEVDVIAVRRGT